ncbi:MAG: cytochrome c oxidase subunit II [Crocinitomicaceae bacterium]|nr:cytochrome c oxidase subunit II [Crocinitomicaceae bacterium]
MGSKLIILLVIILGVIAIAQLVRVNELTAKHSGRREEDIPHRDNIFNANMMLAFMIFFYASFIWLMLKYGYTGMGPAASTHGVETDWLLNLNFVIIIAVFFLTNTLLFVFAWKYVKRPGVKAFYYPHNNKLEMIWTVIPAAVLAVIIILGLRTWNDITGEADPEAENVELFSYQFGWTARYAGMNNVLGEFDYKLTTADNQYALKTRENIELSLQKMLVGGPGEEGIQMIEDKLNNESVVMAQADRKKLQIDLSRKERMVRLLEQMALTYNDSIDDLVNDDVILGDSLVLLVGQKYNFAMRSKDVIHSAYFPHFRAQMNTVPGMTTYFKFQPIYTTSEMKDIMEDEKFEYVLMCNKICGGSHYKMKMAVTVLGPEDYLNWQKTKTTYDGSAWLNFDDRERAAKEAELLEKYKAIAATVAQ